MINTKGINIDYYLNTIISDKLIINKIKENKNFINDYLSGNLSIFYGDRYIIYVNESSKCDFTIKCSELMKLINLKKL